MPKRVIPAKFLGKAVTIESAALRSAVRATRFDHFFIIWQHIHFAICHLLRFPNFRNDFTRIP